MTGQMAAGGGGRDELAVQGRPPLDPSILPAAADLRCGEGGHEELVSKVAPRPNSRFLATWIRAYGTRRMGQEYPIGLCLTYF